MLLGDTIIDTPDAKPGLRQLLDVYEQKQASVVAVHRVPKNWVSRYGIVDGTAEAGNANLMRLNKLVEKPSVAEAPSDLAIAGRYVFTADIFECIDRTTKGVGGEIQLTDAMNMLAREGAMWALAWNAKRYDIGSRTEYAKCFIDFALRRADTGEAVRKHIESLVSGQ